MRPSPQSKAITSENTFTTPVALSAGDGAMVKIRTGGSTVVIQVSNDGFSSDITDAYSTSTDTVQNVLLRGNCEVRVGVKTGGYVGAAYAEIR